MRDSEFKTRTARIAQTAPASNARELAHALYVGAAADTSARHASLFMGALAGACAEALTAPVAFGAETRAQLAALCECACHWRDETHDDAR